MAKLKDSSEIKEAAKIFDELISQSAVVSQKYSRRKSAPTRRMPTAKRNLTPASAPERSATSLRIPSGEPSDVDFQFRGDKLENALFAMCKRGGFSGAVMVDANGLPLAVYNSPVAEESAAAFTMVLGDALEKAGKLLNQTDANNISIDIDYVDKAVIRRFFLNDLPYYLMAICPQDVDERSEIELSIDRVISILRKQ